MPVLFDGRYLVTPTVASAIDDSEMFPPANPSGNVLALIGESTGGIPKRPIRLRSPLHAQQVLRSGPLYEAALRAFAPSNATGSPAVILAVRVDPATQSAAALKDADGNEIMRLKSSDYGSHTTSLEVRLETGSRSGYRVSARQDGQVYYRDNIGAEVLDLHYVGTEESATFSVAAGKLRLEAPSGTVVREYILEDWANAAALAEAMASALPDWSVTLKRGQERFAPARFDALAVTDAKATATTLTGHAWAVYTHLNSSSEIFINAEWAAPLPVAAPAMTGWTPLTGGLNGNVVPTDWEEALGALHETEAHWLVPLTDNPAIWDMVAAHCDFLSANKRERRAFVGAGTGVTAEQAARHTLGLNSDRVGYVWPGIYEYDAVTRELVLKPAYQAAVHLAASFASLNPGTTMSRKSISVAGAEVLLREPTDTDELIQAGVCALVQSEQGVIVSQAVTTWQQDERYNRREMSVGAAVDYVARTVRANLAPFLGDRASPDIIPRATNRLVSVLNDLSVSPPSGPGILVGTPSYRNIQLSLDGDTLRAAFECSPVIPTNYVLVGIGVTPYRGASAAG